MVVLEPEEKEVGGVRVERHEGQGEERRDNAETLKARKGAKSGKKDSDKRWLGVESPEESRFFFWTAFHG